MLLQVLVSAKTMRKTRVAAAAVGSFILAAAMERIAAAVAMAIRHPAPYIVLRTGRLVAVACWLCAADLVVWAAMAIHAAMMAAEKIGTRLLLSRSLNAATIPKCCPGGFNVI